LEDVCTGSGADILAGSRGVANDLSSGTGNDTLYGAASGDTIGDTLDGGTGTNTYIVNTTLDAITDHGTKSVILSSVGYDLSSSLNGGVGNTNGVNNLVYTGTAGATLKGNAASNSISGGGGNETIYGSQAANRDSDTLLGGAGNDLYILNSTRDRVSDSGGVNTIQSGVFTNLASPLVSGVNNLVYTGSSTTLLGNTNANRIDASLAGGGVFMSGGQGADTLIGSSYNDTLVGNGSSSLVGGAGTNTYIVSSAADRINDAGLGSVIRSAVGYDLSSSLNGGMGNTYGVNNLVYTGTAGASIKGNANANTIIGSNGKDTIQGWSGTAASNRASDTLSGGLGADNFILSAARQSDNAYGNGFGAVAKITDFQGGSTGDKLVLHNFGTGHAGSAGYQTLSSGTGVLDVYSYQGADPNHLVAHLTLASGTFSWSANASFV
jgi:Ca2+-binding RTX toxin-like protein